MRTQIATAIVFTFMVAALTMLPANAVGNQAPAADTRLDAEQLPVSLERIKRKLDRLAVAANDRSVLRLRFYCRGLWPSSPYQHLRRIRCPQRARALRCADSHNHARRGDTNRVPVPCSEHR